MREPAMLRLLIGQFQEHWEHQGSPEYTHRIQRSLHLKEGAMDKYYAFISHFAKDDSVSVDMPPPKKKSQRGKRKRKALQSLPNIMEQDIWKDFPEDLLETVIARLPIATMFRFRSVCKRWNSLLASESFSQLYDKIPQDHPWFYTITHESSSRGAVFDPGLKKWHHFVFNFLSPNISTLPVASAGGLVCFSNIIHRDFLVFNPLTRSFREIPARSVKDWSNMSVGMTINSSGYKLIWLASDGEYQVYDSTKNSWICPGVLPAHIRLPLCLNCSSQVVSIGQTLYFMRDPDGIVSYDMANGIWRQFKVPLPLYLIDPVLAESRGQIMLVGLLTKNQATCVCVWELQKMTLLWKEVDRMPNVWCLDLYGKHVRMVCLGNKNILMLSLRSKQMNRLITYDVAKREWERVPSYTLPLCKKRQWISCGTAFYPSLVSVA